MIVGAILAAASWLLFGPLSVETRLEFSAVPVSDASVEWVSSRGSDGAWLHPDNSGRTAALVPADVHAVALRFPGRTPPVVERVSIHAAGVRIWSGNPSQTATDSPDVLSLSWPRRIYTSIAGFELVVVTVVGALAGLLLRPTAAPADATARPGRARVWPALGAVAIVHALAAWHMPLFFASDSMDYAVSAIMLRDTGSFDSFNTWRVPGYAALLTPFVSAWSVLSMLQSTVAVLVAWLSGRITSRFAGGIWPAAAVLLVGLYPGTLTWSRYAMPEIWATLLVTLAAWLATMTFAAPDRAVTRQVAIGAVLGLVLAAACYLRANLLVLAVLAPIGALLTAGAMSRWRQGMLAAGAAAIVCVGALSPWLVRTHSRTGQWALSVGADFQRAQSLWDGRVMDVAQSRAFGAEQSQRLQDMRVRDAGPFEFLAELDRSRLAAESPLPDPWLEHNRRCRVVVLESIFRRPATANAHRAKALSSLLGLHDFGVNGFSENRWWARALLAEEGPRAGNFWNPPRDYGHLSPERCDTVFRTAHRDTAGYRASIMPRILAALWPATGWLAPLIGVFALLTTFFAIRRRRWMLAWLGLVPIAHAGAIAILLNTGIDRYQSPLWPLTAITAVAGLSWLHTILGPRRDRAVRN